MRRVRAKRTGGGPARPVVLVAAPRERPPFPVDGVVLEDDTWLVLGADPEFREPTEHPIRIWTALHEAQPLEPGTVSVVESHPLRLHAIVHDLSRDPTWREEWIGAALAELFRAAGRRGLRSLALPILGGVHGHLPAERFLVLLEAALESAAPGRLERLWLIAPPETLDSPAPCGAEPTD